MVQQYVSTPMQRVQWTSLMIANAGTYRAVTALAGRAGVSRQTLYAWKARGLQSLEKAFTPSLVVPPASPTMERAVLTLLVEGHPGERGIQRCLEAVGPWTVSLGTISNVIREAEERARRWFATYKGPASSRVLALDELYGKQRRSAYLSIVDAHSSAVWETAGQVAVDTDSWTLLLWEAQAHGVRWHQTIGDGGKPIQDACRTVDPLRQPGRDVWHILHQCSQVQGRLDRVVAQLQAQSVIVARQAARVAAGQRPRGRTPVSDVSAHAAHLAAVKRAADGLRYLSSELHRLLGVVVLDHRGVLSRLVRQQELEALLELLAELVAGAPSAQQRELQRLHTGVQQALPGLLVFTEALDRVQQDVGAVLGSDGLALVAWAWQRRAILGPTTAALLAQLPEAWCAAAAVVIGAWEEAVRASSAAENWHSILRPHLAVHRTLPPGLLALLAVYHNHRVFSRGVHAGQSPLQLSGIADAPNDWLVALGYPPVEGTNDMKPNAAQQADLLEAA